MGFLHSKREFAAKALERTGCGSLLHMAGSWRGMLILNYHRIGIGAHSLLDRNLWSATPEEFEHQVREVSRNFDVIGLEDLDHVTQRRRGRYVLITFDDGYLDNYTDAFPILKTYSAKAVFFITTGFLDVPRIPWWDEIAWMVRKSPLRELPANPWTLTPVPYDEPTRETAIGRLLKVYKRLEGSETTRYLEFLADALKSGHAPPHVAHELWMTWAMIREMRQAGMSIGGHTVNHPILANLTPEAQDYEIGFCRQRLERELREAPTAFSYPVGGRTSFNHHTRAALERHGIRWGFTYLGGHARCPITDRYAIPRTAIESDLRRPAFQAMLTLPQFFA